MSLISLGANAMRGRQAVLSIVAAGLMAGCAQIEIPPHQQPLSKDTMMLLGRKAMRVEQPIFVRIFKEESELEVWKQREDGRFYHFKTYPICNWSGDLGPKHKQGDRQSPEGFYRVTRNQMNPNSQFHLSFNLGFPNAYDRAHGRTGDFLMVHGKCKSAGCYAMTDGFMEEIYALSREAFAGGQDGFEVHAFPFRMTAENMARNQNSPHYQFWRTLKQGYDYFELARVPPSVAVCERRYVVNVSWRGNAPARIDPTGACPAYEHPMPEPFAASLQVAEERVSVPGPKTRSFASNGVGRAYGLTNDSIGAEDGDTPSAVSWGGVSRALGLGQ